ncbi:MAG TPA: response regulator transcription factor [Burkholderiales bacterium]|jgi:DNA-binding NarL/FixJ family response regulator|nr:response regulator transcription factor [Burkholderiales bacterium]
MPCRVLLADDHQIFRQGLRRLLEAAGHEIVGEASDGREALRLARTLCPDIAVLDLSMPLLNGLDAGREMRRFAPEIKIILLTMYTDKGYVLQALRAGARGYVLKTQAAEDLILAIRQILRGETYLSPGVAASVVDAVLENASAAVDPLTARERQILQLVAEGNTTKEIAKLLNVSFKTAESHRNHIMKKLDIHEVAGLVRYAIRQGLLHP